MTLRQICEVKDSRLIINLPKSFKDNKKVLVIVDDEVDAREEKMILMKQASNDPLYLSDMIEIGEDFNFADADQE